MNTQLHVLENENSESDLDSQLRYENNSMGKKKKKQNSLFYLFASNFFYFPPANYFIAWANGVSL